jgi:hypothetical protein
VNFENVIQYIRRMDDPGIYIKAGNYWSSFDLTLEEYLADDWYVEDEPLDIWVRRESWPEGAYVRPAPQE